MKKRKLLSYFEDGFDMEKKYSTEQLIWFSEDIYDEWEESGNIDSLTDVVEIERELVKREYNIND